MGVVKWRKRERECVAEMSCEKKGEKIECSELPIRKLKWKRRHCPGRLRRREPESPSSSFYVGLSGPCKTYCHAAFGPRPEALAVRGSSRSIKKSGGAGGGGRPVIVYVRSPKVIHVEPEQFMGIVQRLTGNNQPASTTTSCSSTT
ncbi:hypothetical protein FNV43_RR16704 [Rhamnella rubrinervis]|uniref:VQ domain-containing protein n=1 Tax=Rhamnella rubrinervis TaxID=2594499 RepID=A0A8K0GZ95_9ROSA|nr:hypothetical protein FNV43_RR16704 [Rhamnella rubrinervis]